MDKIEVTIEKLITGGDGLAYVDGKACFIPGSIPGERLYVKIVEDKKSYYRAVISNIIMPSKYRIKPICEIYEKCGGCNFQHIDYMHQLSLKKDIITDVFLRNGKINLGSFNLYSSKPTEYRNRVQFHAVNNKPGFKMKQSEKVIEITTCPVLVPGLNRYLKKSPEILSKTTVFSDQENLYVGGDDNEAIVNINGKSLYFDPSGFFQSNLSILPELIKELNIYILGNTVMDLYCGVGLFSSQITKKIEKIIAVELDSRVGSFIKKNLVGLNYAFYNMSLESYIKKTGKSSLNLDTIIVDPPRKGLSIEVRNFLQSVKAQRVIYVSCDPATMARDLKELTESTYKLIHFSSYDFYPNTSHIECLGVLDLA